jgi:hypothetical protein
MQTLTPPAIDTGLQDQEVIDDNDSVQHEAIDAVLNQPKQKTKVTLISLIRSIDPRMIVTGVSVLGLVIAAGMAYRAATAPPEQEIDVASVNQMDEKTYFLSVDPMVMTRDIRNRVSTDEYKRSLAESIVEYDSKIKESMSNNYRAMVRYRANELLKAAIDEVKTGQLLNNDYAQSIFDMASCPQQTGNPVKCVLLFKATQAVSTTDQANAEKDLSKFARGQAQFDACMVALSGDIELTDFTLEWTSTGMKKQIVALRELNTIAPIGSLPVVQNVIPGSMPMPNLNTDRINTTSEGK